MPAVVTSAQFFLVDTDYPLDKIIYMTTGQVTVGATSTADVPIPHGLTFTPLMDGTYSTSADFNISFDIGSGEPYAGSFGFFAYNTSIDATSSNVNFHVVNFTSSSVTIYYRLFGLMPSGVSEDIASTANSADKFVLNTSSNYTKLFANTRLTTTGTITHGLGYRPQVSVWQEIIGTGIYKIIYADINNPSTPILTKVTTADVQVTINSASYAAHVRVYLDN